MTKATRWWCVSAAVIGTLVLLLAGSNRAQDKKMPGKHDAIALSDSLRDVINTGAKMFNEQGDYAGCYRLYQGSLLSVRPFVVPELQKRIDDGIANAEKMGSYSDRAFELRRVLDEIRASAKTAVKTGDKKDETKDKKKEDTKDKKDDTKDNKKVDGKDTKKDDKKEDMKDKKKDGKKDDGKDTKKDDTKDVKKDDKKVEPMGTNGLVSGTITYEGKPIAGGYSVTLVGKGNKKYTSAIKDGAFQFAAPIPVGEYRVLLEPMAGEKAKVALPPRYLSEERSSLVISVDERKNRIDLNLVK